jgi:magnesium transporter
VRTAILLGYPPESAGRVMTPDTVSLRETMTAADALAKVRRRASAADTLHALPVTDDRRGLVGMVDLRDLVVADQSKRVGELIRDDLHKVAVDTDQEVAARLIQEADLVVLPVVDTEDRLVGVITVDDAMEIIEAEDTEDIHRAGGSEPLGRPYLSASTVYLARKRAAWLLVLVLAAALTVNVMGYFEETLEAVVTLALFIPLLIDTGGNSGSQAATVVIRAMAVDEVRFRDVPAVAWRELRVGVLLGTMLALVALPIVSVIFGGDIGAVVSLTIVTICIWATFTGAILPLVANRLGFDPAVVSAPVITTFVDATGLIIYFLIARWLLDQRVEAATQALGPLVG